MTLALAVVVRNIKNAAKTSNSFDYTNWEMAIGS
jgi:hypothetical protein